MRLLGKILPTFTSLFCSICIFLGMETYKLDAGVDLIWGLAKIAEDLFNLKSRSVPSIRLLSNRDKISEKDHSKYTDMTSVTLQCHR